MRKIGSVYSRENYRNCCHLMSDFKAKKAPNSISAEALYAPHPAIGELTCCSQTPTDPILAFGPPGLETTCLPKYVSLNPPMKQSRRRPPPNPPDRWGARRKMALSRCKGGPERALLVVKGRIGWRKGRITLERATRAHRDENCTSKRGRKRYGGCCSGGDD